MKVLMRIAKVIGQVTLNKSHPVLLGGALKLAVAQSLRNLTGTSVEQGDEIVVYDTLGAGQDELIMMTEGMEAAQPFRPDLKAIDAYNSGILDTIELSDEICKKLA
jgi:microcompartment protein CcmK/EutM